MKPWETKINKSKLNTLLPSGYAIMIQHRPQKIVFSASVTHLPCPYKVRKQTLTSTTHLGTRSGHRDDNDLLKFFNKNKTCSLKINFCKNLEKEEIFL